jgi:exopolyphosphatase/pppGpp-phosphohydrolase
LPWAGQGTEGGYLLAVKDNQPALHNFKELLRGWDIKDEDIHVIATSALMSARNRDVFVDRYEKEQIEKIRKINGREGAAFFEDGKG